MLQRPKVGWHKARALSALQTYFKQPLSELLPDQVDLQLKRLSVKAIEEQVSPIDTALRYYAEFAAEHVARQRPLDEIGFFGVLGRITVLRDKLDRYDEHHKTLLAIANAEKELRQ